MGAAVLRPYNFGARTDAIRMLYDSKMPPGSGILDVLFSKSDP
jgi:hypothetical protein